MNKSHKVSKTKDRRLVDNLSAIAKQIKREYFYMSDKCLDAIISRVPKDVESVLVIDDAGLQVVRKLYDLGIKDVTLTFYTYDIKDIFDNFVYIINNTFRDLNVKLVNFEEAIKMKFDLVISNPPYGKIGAQITKKIIDEVDYKDFINLLPIIDYTKYKDTYKYVDVSEVDACPGAFEDAAIIPSITKVHKNLCNDLDAMTFRIMTYDNDHIKKYFINNITKDFTYTFIERDLNDDMSNVIFLPMRVTSGNHKGKAGIGKTDKSSAYRINKNIMTSISELMRIKNTNALCGTRIVFDTIREKLNVSNFLYSEDGYNFMSFLMTTMARDVFHSIEHISWFPKVDWTRSWTIEEILKEYNYTDEEIKEVMEDLKNFKGMNE